jgi:hypothetical protein
MSHPPSPCKKNPNQTKTKTPKTRLNHPPCAIVIIWQYIFLKSKHVTDKLRLPDI